MLSIVIIRFIILDIITLNYQISYTFVQRTFLIDITL